MDRPALVLGRYENRHGVTSWRVPGNLPGLRVRRNCKSREEASAEKATLELKSIQTAEGLDTVATVLTGPHIREAEALFQRFAANSRPLSFSVDFTLANDREPERQSPPPEAIRDYVAAKEHEHVQGQISATDATRRSA